MHGTKLFPSRPRRSADESATASRSTGLSIPSCRATFNATVCIERLRNVIDRIQQQVQQRVRTATGAALDKKAYDLDVLAVGELTTIADYFILCSASNE